MHEQPVVGVRIQRVVCVKTSVHSKCMSPTPDLRPQRVRSARMCAANAMIVVSLEDAAWEAEKAWQTRVPSQARSYLVARATALLRHPARGTRSPPAIVDPTADCHHGIDLGFCHRHPRACTGVLKSVKKAEPHQTR